MHKLAIYDLDKTVTRLSTGRPMILYSLKHHQPWRWVFFPALLVVGLFYGCGLLNRTQGKYLALRLMIGPVIPDSVSHGFAAQTLAGNICPGALQQIATDSAAGYRLVLATASQRFSATPIGKALGFDVVIASENVMTADGLARSKPDGANCYGEEKLHRVEAWLAQQQIARSDAHIRFYTDHVSDAPLLAFADEGIAVNAHQPLRMLSARNGWPIKDWA
jgi:HAD superfamily phosphoserine phosphatase-like hydrolase